MPSAKICGLKDARALDAALAGGARFVGFVFFPKSPRHLSAEAAAPLMAHARGRADTVAVVADADDNQLAEIARIAKPDWIQAHGQESPARLVELRRFAAKGVIKALSVARAEDFQPIHAIQEAADFILFDAKPPAGADRPGGNAAAFDWTLLKNRSFRRPWLLSGGLTPENVREAMAASGADLVDVSSGVESALGLKDPARIAAFLAAARAGPGT